MRTLLAVALTAASSWAIAQPVPGRPPRPATIQVTGEAKVAETPNRVYIDVGVTTQAQKSDDAAAQNASRLAAVIAAAKHAAGSSAQLTTTEYSINPNYEYRRNGGTPTIVGYTVSNVMRIRLDDLGRIGRVIDAATQAGANNVQNISFTLRDERAPRSEALRQAALNARQDADALADALGLRIVRVLAVNEEGQSVVPVYPRGRIFAQAQAMAAPTPVEAGTVDVTAAVTLTLEVAPATR